MSPDTRPFVESLAGDPRIGAHFRASAEISTMLTFEACLAEAQAALGIIPVEAATAIQAACEAPFPDAEIDAIQAGMARDGVPVPAFVKALRARIGAPHATFLHHGATSQDVVDTGLMLRLKRVFARLDERIGALLDRLAEIAEAQGQVPLMAQTRMQVALPFSVHDKLATWSRPLENHRARLARFAAGLPIQLGGPIGNGDSFGPQYAALRAELATRLGLKDAEPWQSDRTVILDAASAFALLTGTLGKIGQDLGLMAQNGIETVKLTGSGGSSAMAHKQNPVGAEVLVALARLNAGLLGTLSQSMVHENERSGAAWTLEWFVLPKMAESAGAATLRAEALLDGLIFRADLAAPAP